MSTPTTTTTPAAGPATAPAAGRVGPARVFRSEWIKLRSLRSTWACAGVAAVATVGIGVLITAVAASQPHVATDPAAVASRAEFGNLLSLLAIGVLAVLAFSGEYGTGQIRSSLTAVPTRLPVLWAKLGVLAAVVLPLALVSSAAAFAISQAPWRAHGHGAVWFGDAGVTRIVAGSALALVVSGVCGLALGALIRNTAGAVTTFVGVFFVLPNLMGILPARLGDLGRFLPLNAGGALWNTTLTARPLHPLEGFAVLGAYAVVLVLAAAQRLRRGDV